MPPNGVAIFTLSLPSFLSDSIRQPLISAVAAIISATTAVWLVHIVGLHIFRNNTPLYLVRFHLPAGAILQQRIPADLSPYSPRISPHPDHQNHRESHPLLQIDSNHIQLL